MALTESPEHALRFPTEGDALNAGEDFCYANWATHARSNVDAAQQIDGGWLAVITREGNDFDEFVSDCAA